MKMDTAFFCRFRDGDPDALDAVVRQFRTLIRSIVRTRIGCPYDRDDVTQDVWLRVSRFRATFDVSRPIEPWLIRVARNACVDHLRTMQRRRESRTDIEEILPSVVGSDPNAGKAGELSPCPDVALAVRRVLDELTPDQQTAMRAIFVDGKRNVEAARLIGRSPGTIGTWKRRFVQRLRTSCH